MWNHPLDPDTIVFLLEIELLKTFYIEVSDVFILEDLFCLIYVFLTLVYHIHCFVHLTKQLFGNSADPSPAVDNPTSRMLRMCFKVPEYEFEWAWDISGAQILISP